MILVLILLSNVDFRFVLKLPVIQKCPYLHNAKHPGVFCADLRDQNWNQAKKKSLFNFVAGAFVFTEMDDKNSLHV